MSDLLTYHPPIIAMRAAWQNALTGQEAVYFPSIIGGQTWNAPPTAANLKNWKWVRHGILTIAQNTLVNLAVLQQGTPWLAAEQPVSWSLDSNQYASLQGVDSGSIYGDNQQLLKINPNLPTPDPSEAKIKGYLGRAVLITGTYADGSTIVEQLLLYPQLAQAQTIN